MNRLLNDLQPYPFERLRALLRGVEPPAAMSPIAMSIGEPRHRAPACVRDAMVSALDGLSSYPPTAGGEPLRRTVAGWLERRYRLPRIDPATQVLPVNGSKEALFAIAQLVVDVASGAARPYFVCDRAGRHTPRSTPRRAALCRADGGALLPEGKARGRSAKG